MTQIMTASNARVMTDGQIENAVSKLRDAMRKHRSEIISDVAQQVLGVENLGMMMFAPFRERAEAVSNLIVRKVKVNRSRSLNEAFGAADCTWYVDREVGLDFDLQVIGSMPKALADNVEILFFRLDNNVSYDSLEKELELHNLKFADPYSIAAVNEADYDFLYDNPHSTQWKDARGNWYYVTFSRGIRPFTFRQPPERMVRVGLRTRCWKEGQLIACVRKPARPDDSGRSVG